MVSQCKLGGMAMWLRAKETEITDFSLSPYFGLTVREGICFFLLRRNAWEQNRIGPTLGRVEAQIPKPKPKRGLSPSIVTHCSL